MDLLLIGAGSATQTVREFLYNKKHNIVVQTPILSRDVTVRLKYDGVVVIAPESQVGPGDLVDVAKEGKHIFIVAGPGDALNNWASSHGVKSYSYPPDTTILETLSEEIYQAGAGVTDDADTYRRRVLDSSQSAAILGLGSLKRKIVITSPKGGTGKSTVAVNLALLFAMCGITTYLVDADANGGCVHLHLRCHRNSKKFVRLPDILMSRAARMDAAGENDDLLGIERAASAGEYLQSYVQYDGVPLLKVVTGFETRDLGLPALNNERAIEKVISGLFDAGTAAGGVVIMDVGINPSHPIHRAALRNAETIAAVVKPEVPDVASTRSWISMMVNSLEQRYHMSHPEAINFILSRIRIAYNMVSPYSDIAAPHQLLRDAVAGDLQEKDLKLAPNAILPTVDPQLQIPAVNSNNSRDLFIWRYRDERPEELAAFSEALVGFASNFMPIRDIAVRAGFIPSSAAPKKQGLFSWSRKK
jgi:MinD-like ATPase involved in chromosome partitioning or flagellar assembly